MPTLTEWANGTRSDGSPLPADAVERYRAKVWSRGEEFPEARSRLVELAERGQWEPPAAQANRSVAVKGQGLKLTGPRPAKRPQPPPHGQARLPGDCLVELLTEMGLHTDWCETCQQRRATMNAWGVEGCVERIDTIAGWLGQAAEKVSTTETLSAAWSAATHGIWVNPLDPYRGLAWRAINLSKARQEEMRPSFA